MLRSRRAQSTLEYILVFTAVVAAIIFFANSVLKPKVGNMLEHVANEAETAVNHISFGGNTTTTAP